MAEVKSLRHASLIVYVTAVGLVVALEALVVPLYGDRFRPAINLGLILLPGAALVPLARVLAATILGRGKPNYPLIAAVVTTPVTLLLYVTLIPWLHATGAALASTISYAATFIALAYFYRRVTGRKVLPSLVPTRSELEDLLALKGHIAPKRAERPS